MGTGALTLSSRELRVGRIGKLAGVAVLAALTFLPVAISIRAGIFDSFVDNPLSGWGMWGTFAIYAWTRPSRREFALTVAIATVLRIAYALLIGERGYEASFVIGMGVFLGPA